MLFFALLLCLMSSGIAAFTVTQGWLSSSMLSFVPVLFIIMVGISLTFMGFNYLRFLASAKLKVTDLTKGDLLTRVLEHRKQIETIYTAASQESRLCGDNKVGPDDSTALSNASDMDEIVMGNNLYAEMIGAKSGADEDDELHAKR